MKTPKASSSDKKRKLRFASPDNSKSKIPKLNELSTIDENLELIELSDRRDDSLQEEEQNLWISNLKLTDKDKTIINDKNGKLHSQHIEAVSKLLRKQFGNKIGGLQLCEKVPKFDDNKKIWTTFTPFQPAKEKFSCQIHHNHKDHWVTSIQHNDSIYLIDSLGNERPNDRIIPDGLKIQLSQIYGKNEEGFDITVPLVQKQDNSIDCGLFAVAYATSYCIRQKLCFDLIFDPFKLRQHLISCLENETMSEFPTTKKTLSTRRKKLQKIISIENYCICNLPACLGDQVQCDKCSRWYHKHCVEAPADVSHADVEFVCSVC
ncbi:uncharacterized protein LOC128547884 isoform X1 [Mercenaria mercenaria]|uniref:uncharacterized protein LOC128547884 isoform X1 n=1 Tax=Mercenaria mercenaria TaxID=6596 RepID=UPI00234F6700|nr:uncharacterized protein LOC128547884 isoform X1 [Mercenaria mercenaria]